MDISEISQKELRKKIKNILTTINVNTAMGAKTISDLVMRELGLQGAQAFTLISTIVQQLMNSGLIETKSKAREFLDSL